MQKLIAANTELDLEKEVSIPLEFQIADVRDIAKRSGGFSKTIVLPGTEKNNQFFGGLYDFNADFTLFNPNVKTPVLFINNGDEFINGYMQLKEVTRDDKGNVNYNVVLYDSVVDFWNALDKLTLGDLDYSELDHVYNKDNIVTSWGHSYTDGYYYPLLYSNSLTHKTTQFKPAIYLRYLLEKIMTASGFTFGGNLFNDPIFDEEVIQNEVDRPVISPTVAASKTFRASTDPANILTDAGAPADGTYPITRLAVNANDETTPPNDDSNGLWSLSKYTAPIIGLYRFNFDDVRFNISLDYTVSGSPFTPAYASYNAKLVAVIKDDLNNVIDDIDVQTFLFASQQQLLAFNTTATFQSSALVGTLSSNNSQDIYLEPNWTVEFFIEFEANQVLKRANGQPYTANYSVDEVRINVNSGVFSVPFIQYAYTDNIPLTFSDFITSDFAQKEVLKDIQVRYNCFIYPDPDNPRRIIFDKRDEFYQAGAVLDWTDKKDFNTRDKIKLIAELQSEELLLTYKKGEDETNKNYTATIGEENIYGQFEYNFGNEFVKGKKKVESPYVPSPLVQHGGIAGAVVSAIHANEPVQGMRVLYAGGLIEVGNVSWNFQFRDANGALQTDVINGYPYAGHYDNPFTPTIDINFGELPFPQIYYSYSQYTNNNIFNRNYRNTINQTADGRLVITKFNLTSADAYFIKANPNTRIFVDNRYYYINKFRFEGNEELRGLTAVELITVEDELNFETGTSDPIVIGDIKEKFDFLVGDGGTGGLIPAENEADFNNLGLNNSIAGVDNTIGNGSNRVAITGNNNFVNGGLEGVTIQGDNNRVFGNNVTLIGVSGVTVRSDNVSIINGRITKGCKEGIFYQRIDGGLNSLSNPNRCSKINVVSSEKDGEFDIFNVNLWNVIDSEDGIQNEI